MNQKQLQQAARHSRYMGMVYGVIVASEAANTPCTYEVIREVMIHHCSEREFKATLVEMVRIARIIQTLDIPQ